VRDLVSTAGTALDHVVYDSYGNITTETNASNGDGFKYAGMEFDETIGQYFDRARDFNQVVGRFSRLDPIGFRAGDADLFRYVGNSPTNEIDASGELYEPQGPPERPGFGFQFNDQGGISTEYRPAGGSANTASGQTATPSRPLGSNAAGFNNNPYTPGQNPSPDNQGGTLDPLEPGKLPRVPPYRQPPPAPQRGPSYMYYMSELSEYYKSAEYRKWLEYERNRQSMEEQRKEQAQQQIQKFRGDRM
jgi:RHS repeat-associated protein